MPKPKNGVISKGRMNIVKVPASGLPAMESNIMSVAIPAFLGGHDAIWLKPPIGGTDIIFFGKQEYCTELVMNKKKYVIGTAGNSLAWALGGESLVTQLEGEAREDKGAVVKGLHHQMEHPYMPNWYDSMNQEMFALLREGTNKGLDIVRTVSGNHFAANYFGKSIPNIEAFLNSIAYLAGNILAWDTGANFKTMLFPLLLLKASGVPFAGWKIRQIAKKSATFAEKHPDESGMLGYLIKNHGFTADKVWRELEALGLGMLDTQARTAWSMILVLAKQPELYAEINTEDDIRAFSQAVAAIYHASPYTARETLEDEVICEVDVPKGTKVGALWAVASRNLLGISVENPTDFLPIYRMFRDKSIGTEDARHNTFGSRSNPKKCVGQDSAEEFLYNVALFIFVNNIHFETDIVSEYLVSITGGLNGEGFLKAIW